MVAQFRLIFNEFSLEATVEAAVAAAAVAVPVTEANLVQEYLAVPTIERESRRNFISSIRCLFLLDKIRYIITTL